MNFLIKLLLVGLFLSTTASANTLVEVIKKNKPAVVGIGVHTPIGQPKNQLYGSGFVIGNGNYIVTNYHVIPNEFDESLLEKLVVFTGTGPRAKTRVATLIAYEQEHDLAILKIEGKPLSAMSLAKAEFIPEGSNIAFTGFPIGAVLGLYPVTHRGIIAGITPTITPVDNAGQISIAMLKRLRDPYLVYQLDATAYPGNSGSAMYNADTGEVVGIINKVFVQKTKETVISDPSGITYAIPVKYLHQLLKKHNITW